MAGNVKYSTRGSSNKEESRDLMDLMNFTFTDLIAGYVTSFDAEAQTFGLKTSDDREFTVQITDATYAELMRNLDEPWQDPGGPLEAVITPGKYVYAYGIFYPEAGAYKFETQHIMLVGDSPDKWRFEEPDWWVRQIRSLADFYYRAQFGDGTPDYSRYRTQITLEGQAIEGTRQETDTISRMVYGFASAYLLTGEDRYLDAAEQGTEYLRDHMRAVDEVENVVYWYHANDVKGGRERKILASEFGDDFEAIPAYEQIYALAGPVQTYRVTGDPLILSDAERTVRLFKRFFRDDEKGGYFSHIDPVSFDPRDQSLGHNRARKNWNSIGDHAPAYLINLWLATGVDEYADMLQETADLIVEHFPDYENSPFVNEKFHEDWSHDLEAPLQKNRSIIGHNLKIAWNLMRIQHMRPDKRYEELARQIGEVVPKFGMDKQRGGWYDMIQRERSEGQEWNRLVWHDRKAWWQQEQGILAYMMLAGSFGEDEHVRFARESAAFYNAWFPDHDSGGVYFNVLATGVPFLTGTERLKGSHSMSGYHSFELCYLAAVYTNLLRRNQPMDFYFKPQPGALKDNLLRVQPDILPPGSVRIDGVWLNGREYTDFDAEAMTVHLPEPSDGHPLAQRPAYAGSPKLLPPTSNEELRIRVRLVPTRMPYDVEVTFVDGTAEVLFRGVLGDDAELALRQVLGEVHAARPDRLSIEVSGLRELSPRMARVLAFYRSSMPLEMPFEIRGITDPVRQVLGDVGVLDELDLL